MKPEKFRNYLRKYTLGSFFLISLSMFYFLAITIREFLYKIKLIKITSIKTKIICFGNISSGGTGKTSAVIETARLLAQKGKKTAIIMRGYARTGKTKETVILNEENNCDISLSGDEALVIKDSLKEYNVPVLINSKREKAAIDAERIFSPDMILMDDGFQRFSLKRNLDIVLINCSEGLNGSLLPYGNLREPYSALKRASAIILTHCENLDEKYINEIKGKISRINSSCPIFLSSHIFDRIYRPIDNKTLKKEEFEGISFSAFSSIGDPDSFERNIRISKINLIRTLRYPDHHPFSQSDIVSIANVCNDSPILTTYKDFVRLPSIWKEKLGEKLHIFSVKLSFMEDPEFFLKLLDL